MSNHTRAPWSIEYDHATNTPEFIRASVDGEMLDVASVLCNETGNLEANARLISAAPELLACLLDVLEADGDLYAMDFDRYREVISKATGEPEEVDTYHEWDCRGDT